MRGGAAALAIPLLLSACIGTVGGDDVTNAGGGVDATHTGAGSAALRCEASAPSMGPTPMRRLTHAEYDDIVAELLGDATHPARSFAPDPQVGLFDNTVTAQTVPTLLGEQYLDAAVSLAEAVADIEALLRCDPAGAGGADCVRGFIGDFGRRAYRRPLAEAEIADLFGVYDAARADSDEATGVRAVLASVLSSPNFLFRPEFGDANAPSAIPNAVRLTPFEVAARLASLMWASAPDDALLRAASAGELATKEQIATQARRMLADPRARPALAAVYDQWLGLSALESVTKDAAAYPEFDDGLRASMLEETRRFVASVVWDGDARVSTLLTAPYTFVNGPLAKLYGVPAPADPTAFVKVDLDPGQRAGIVTQPSLLTAFARADESSPAKRGKWVRVRMLCGDLPDPPPGIPPLSPPRAGLSPREQFAQHTNDASCRGCHRLIDGIGFGLEHYDGIGRFRTMDQGVAVDSSGDIVESDIDGAYDGGPELASKLAKSAEVRDCVVTQYVRHALARREEADDGCEVLSVRSAFEASGGDLREILVALTQTDAFVHYRAPK
jgi:hypothetical protein